MDDFDERLKRRMDAVADAEAQEKRQKEADVRQARERAEQAATIVRNSAGVVFHNMAERLRLQNLDATSFTSAVDVRVRASATLEVATKTRSPKRGRIVATKHPNRDTIGLDMTPNFGGLGKLEFEHTDKAGIEKAVQGWVLDFIDG
ncbi:hypothetical protein [Deinococcus yunweiensis]|uniref:hypothetical protein n=1 Tax=Deinococcus yunweiensis TaxID=367282 RepID=UPI00398EE2C9